MELSDQVALVTGAGRGIGRATALALAQAGADVAVNDLPNLAAVEEVAAEIRQLGRRAWVVTGDVADQSTVESLISSTAEEFGKLNIAVANAYYSAREPFWNADMERFRRTIDVTMWGAYYMLRAATSRMISQGQGGSIICIGSPHAIVPVPMAMAYNMAKAAVDQMARTAATELLEHRIRVNIVHPGWVDTPGERTYATEKEIQKAAKKLPWKRMGRPDEIARGVVFLCSPSNEYITGTTLSIDGGINLPWWAKGGSGVPQ